MILFYSGTGNSAYVAKRIGKEIGDEVRNLFDEIKNSDFSEIHSESPWVIVTPTYAWRIPRIVQNWLEHTSLTGSKEFYFVMTCGDSIGNAGKYLEKFCVQREWNYRGCIGITMPENYIAMFPTPTEDAGLQIIDKAESVIDRVAHDIMNDEDFPRVKISLIDRMLSGFINDLFYPMFVHAKKFRVSDGCVSCGKCVDVCPMSNVRLENGKPSWGDNCTHCMACISYCPKEAIEYGKHSRGLPRYTCKKNV